MAGKGINKILTLLGFDEQIEEESGVRDDLPIYTRPQTPYSHDRSRRSSESETTAVPATAGARSDERRAAGIQSMPNAPSSAVRMVVYQPQNFEDTQTIIDSLKGGRPVIVNLENLQIDAAQRVLDFISGAIYALDGSVRKISKGIFLLAPPGVDISGNLATGLPGELRQKKTQESYKRRD